MLVALQIRGKWDGRRYVFDAPSIVKVYKGPLARALGGSGGSEQKFFPTGPWSQQIPYIEGLFSEASRMYNQGPPQYFPGQTVAQPSQALQNNQQAILNQGQQSNNTLNSAMQYAQGQLQAPTMAGQVGQGQITPYNTAINSLLQSSIQNPTQSVAQSALPAFYSGLQQASQQAGPVNAERTAMGNVNANPALMRSLYSNGMNPYTSQIVDAALRSQNQQFAQNVLPQISSQANMVGQLGGTRQGIAEGIAAQQHQNMQKDLISQLYGQAFDVGTQERLQALGLVGQGQQFNAQNQLAAQQLMEQQRQATMQSGLGQSQMVGNLLGQGQQLGQQGAAQAGQLTGNMIQSGSAQNVQQDVQNAALLPGLNQAMGQNLSMGNQVGLQQLGQNQANIDAEVERWFYNQYAPLNMLTQYQNWVSGPYGAYKDTRDPGSQNVIGPGTPGYSPQPSAPPIAGQGNEGGSGTFLPGGGGLNYSNSGGVPVTSPWGYNQPSYGGSGPNLPGFSQTQPSPLNGNTALTNLLTSNMQQGLLSGPGTVVQGSTPTFSGQPMTPSGGQWASNLSSAAQPWMGGGYNLPSYSPPAWTGYGNYGSNNFGGGNWSSFGGSFGGGGGGGGAGGLWDWLMAMQR